MFRTTVIAITGSVGKTTAKECLAAALSARGRTLKTLYNRNDAFGVPRTVLAMRPWHRYAVIEVATDGPGRIERSARLVKPDIAIVLSVAGTHTRSFRSLDETAAEKAKLLEALPRGGTALLNGDDPRVRSMAEGCRARVSFFGRGSDCDPVAEDVRSAWPARLHFTVRCGSDRWPVRTQLVGAHWVSSVLASLAAARECGVPMPAAVGAVAEVAPVTARMQPVALPSGAVVIRDEMNGSPDSLRAMLDVLRDARARRRILVFGDVSDSKGNTKKRQHNIGRIAAELADVAVFVSEHGHRAVRAAVAAGMDPAACHATPALADAALLLGKVLQPGDLVFLKSRATDHVSRVVFAQLGSIGCWKTRCRKKTPCDECGWLRADFDLGRALAAPIATVAPD